jgi:hypothetical protein
MTSLDSFAIGQHPIHDDTVDAFFLNYFITFFQCGHPGDLISASAEVFLHGIADIVCIFHDENMHYLANEIVKVVCLFGTLSMEIFR